jgi:hypothetical protein
MNKGMLYLTGAGVAGVITALAGQAAAATIDCPATQVRREITTPLPGGWWNTPIVDRLSDTRVVNIGGRPALQCVYGQAGSVQRNAPVGETCTATPRGFVCRPLRPPVPPPPPPRPAETFSTGPVSLPQTYLVNLDNGNVTSGPQADLWFQAETATRLFLAPQNGAMIAVGDRSNRGFAGCSRAAFSSARVPLAAVPVGSYVCVRTNQGRISQFRVNGISGGPVKTLQLGYTTWR